MKSQQSTKNSRGDRIIGWIFGVIFLAIGVLNALLIHHIPGAIYLLLSLVYLPPVSTIFTSRYNFSIPVITKFILGLIILWGTLAVGDLAEMFGL